MSSNHSSHDHPSEHQSEDQIAFGKVISIGLIALVVFALGTLWAVTIFKRETARVHAASGVTRQPVLGRTEIGIVDQVLFTTDHRLAAWRAERTARLNGYGWVDRSKGIVHIPIEKALELAAGGALPDGAPTDAAPAAKAAPADKAPPASGAPAK